MEIQPRDAENLILHLMDTLASSTLNTTGQYDMAHSVYGVARFRVNIF